MQPRFDAYTATTRVLSVNQAMSCLDFGAQFYKHSRGFKGFEHRISFIDSDQREFGSVQHGGMHGDLIMMEVKGERTPDFVDRLRSVAEHRCTRVDSCVDFEEPGAFEKILVPCLQVKKDHRLKGSKAGDWDDFPEEGRTLYLGASTSVARARAYEKGLQPEYRHLNRPDYCRVEVQVRPAKEAKDRYSVASAEDVWGASKWTRQLAALLLESKVLPLPAGSVRRETVRDHALRFMCRQYGLHIQSLRTELGSDEELGRVLAGMVKEQSLIAKGQAR